MRSGGTCATAAPRSPHGGGGGRGRRLHRDRIAARCPPRPWPSKRCGQAPMRSWSGQPHPRGSQRLKFYRPDGEITKADEVAILAPWRTSRPAARDRRRRPRRPSPTPSRATSSATPPPFAPDILKGLRIAVYQQSSVARDLLSDLLAAFGAQVTPIGRGRRSSCRSTPKPIVPRTSPSSAMSWHRGVLRRPL